MPSLPLLSIILPPRKYQSVWSVQKKGQWGERVVANHLWRRGHRILANRWKGSAGKDIDLIAANRDYLLFCEVKVRSGDQHLWDEILDENRIQALVDTVGIYLRAKGQRLVSIRFAAFLVHVQPDGTPRVEVHPDYINPRVVPGWRGRVLPPQAHPDLS